MTNPFPEIILNLPEAKMPVPGSLGYLLQGEKQQVVFMTFDQDTNVPEHAHNSQWEMVVAGQAELTIGGVQRSYTNGEAFFIPAGTPHSAKITAGYASLAFFDQKDRYQVKA